MYKDVLIDFLAKETRLREEELNNLIEIPPNIDMGDYAFPCFVLSKKEKKAPNVIAEHFAKSFINKLPKEFVKVENKGPYLNFFIDKKILAEDIIKINANFGKQNLGKKKIIAIDYSSVNVGKPMHVGHIRSTMIGDSLMRIHDFLNYKSLGINYLGDVGLHIGKLIVAYELWLDKEALKKDPTQELLRLYVKFCKEEKSQVTEGLEEDMQDNEWTNKAKETIKKIELGDKKTIKIWKDIEKASGKGFEKVYKMLNVKFHDSLGQSHYEIKGKEIVTEALKKGFAKREPDGAIYMDVNDPRHKEPIKKYILRSNGTASYITYDFGAAFEHYKKYKFEKKIYITDSRQIDHFKSLFLILKELGYEFSDKLVHLPFGTISFGNEILATREGKVILLEDVLKKAIEKAKVEIDKRKTKGDPEKVGVGAIKYLVLKYEPAKDVNFTWESALSFEGNTGPYLQYSFARASSIIKKRKNFNKSNSNSKLKLSHELANEEYALIKKISDFPDIILQAKNNMNPALIATYSFQLAQVFNEFYHACPVLSDENKSEEAFRLRLVDSFRTTLKNSLHLLGIDVMDEM